MRQTIQMVMVKKPKNTGELLEVENSQTTGAKPTKRREVMAMKVNITPTTSCNLAFIPPREPNI